MKMNVLMMRVGCCTDDSTAFTLPWQRIILSSYAVQHYCRHDDNVGMLLLCRLLAKQTLAW